MIADKDASAFLNGPWTSGYVDLSTAIELYNDVSSFIVYSVLNVN